MKIAVLGCTGSIGRQTLDIARAHRDEISVVGLSCASSADDLAALAREFDCKSIGIYDHDLRARLRSELPRAAVFWGEEALTAVADEADVVVVAVVGMVGLKAVLHALKQGKRVALANKESLVAGGEAVKQALRGGGSICPVDSEHSAVWQCLRGERDFKRIVLTASGGPFLFTPQSELGSVTPERAVAHPNWKMGKKISVDSATMMNKCLEIIEAHYLFDTDNIDYVIHPESVVHSFVEFADGSIKAQASFPDMRLPIQYALFGEHEEREYTPLSLPLSLRFLPPDEQKFPAPALARRVMASGGTSGAVLNAANEAAVRLFLEGCIPFTGIVPIVSEALAAEPTDGDISADNIFQTHNRVYDKIYLTYTGG